jgi:hypothetical protein
MIARHATFAAPRHGASREQYEDAAHGPVVSGRSARLAVADGATESAFARRWARMLVAEATLAPLAEAIASARASFAREAASGTASLPWYAEAKAAEGAHATVLAVEVDGDGAFLAEAVGDCVLFHVRGIEPRLAWPIAEAAAFDNRPALVASGEDVSLPNIQKVRGCWEPGDRLLLATDALAAYLLANDPLAAAGLDEAGFRDLVQQGRQRGMRNDDVTLVEVELR